MSIKLSPDQAFSLAESSLRMEGLTLNSANTTLLKQMASGAITGDQLRAKVIEQVKGVAKSPRKHVAVIGR